MFGRRSKYHRGHTGNGVSPRAARAELPAVLPGAVPVRRRPPDRHVPRPSFRCAAIDPRSRRCHRMFSLDCAPAVPICRVALPPADAERKTDLLPEPSNSLDAYAPAERRNYEVSLFKRGNTWWVYLYQDGIRHQYSTGTGNRKQAEKIHDKLK